MAAGPGRQEIGSGAGQQPPGAEGGLSPAQKEAADKKDRARLLKSSGFSKLLGMVRLLDNTPDPENRVEFEKQIDREYDKVFFNALEHPLNAAQTNLEYRNGYATWESHPGRNFLDGVLTALKDEDHELTLLKEEGKEDKISPEREAWTKRMYGDFSWMRGTYAFQEGIGHIMKYYFSGPDQMLNALYEQRLNPTADRFIKTFKKIVKALKLSEEQVKHTFKFKKRTFSEPAQDGSREVRIEDREGIRETALRMQNDRFRFVVLAAELGQIDWNRVVKNANGTVNIQATLDAQGFDMKMSEDEYTVLNGLFVKDHKEYNGINDVPNEVATWFTITDTHDNKEEYKALLEALLLENARDEINSVQGKSNEDKRSVLQGLVDKVRTRAEKLQDEELQLTLEEKLAKAVVKSGIATDLAFGFSLKLGWNYRYKDRYYRIVKTKDDEGKDVDKYIWMKNIRKDQDMEKYLKANPGVNMVKRLARKVEIAGIYTGLDTYTVGWPFHHDALYDTRASRRSSVVPPTDSMYRDFVLDYPPTKWPALLWGKHGAVARDPALAQAMAYLFGQWTPTTGEISDEIRQKGIKFQENTKLGLTRDQAVILMKLMWGWGTGWNSDNVTSFDYTGVSEKGSQQNFFALAIPKEVGILLFPQTVKLEDHKDEQGNAITLWEELTRNGFVNGEATGKPLDWSDIQWGDMKEDMFDRWHVDMNMLGRIIVNLVDPMKEDFKKQFFENPSLLKELLKRLYLGLRDETIKMQVPVDDLVKAAKGETTTIQVPGQLLWCTYASTLIAWHVSNDKSLVSQDFEDTAMVFKNGEVKNNQNNSLIDWLSNEFWMPGDMPDFESFNQPLTLLTFINAYQMYAIAGDDRGGGDEAVQRAKAQRLIEYLPNLKHSPVIKAPQD